MSWLLGYDKDQTPIKKVVLNEILNLIGEGDWNEEDLAEIIREATRTLEAHFHLGDSPAKQDQTLNKLYDASIEVISRFKRGDRHE